MLTSPHLPVILLYMDSTPTLATPLQTSESSQVSPPTAPSDVMRGLPSSSSQNRPTAQGAAQSKPLDRSSWISEVLYKGTGDGGFLAIFPVTKPGSEPEAMLYGPNVPSWVPGLLQAGLGGVSVGRAYHKHVKGKYAYKAIKGSKEVAELRKLFLVG